jgi:FHS family L-fucose permease-like MFS transporter
MTISPLTKTTATPTTSANYARPLAIVTTLFFMWGLLMSLDDVLVPHLKPIFDLGYAGAMLVQFAFFSAYFLFSIPWSHIVTAIGYQRTMVAGLIGMAAGALLFVPAAAFASFPLFLGALVVLAAGITGLQLAANPMWWCSANRRPPRVVWILRKPSIRSVLRSPQASAHC